MKIIPVYGKLVPVSLAIILLMTCFGTVYGSPPIKFKMDTNDLEMYEISKVLMEFERSVKHQCTMCLEHILDGDRLGKSEFDLLRNAFTAIAIPDRRPRYAPNTSTWDFDLSIHDVTVVSANEAVASVSCLFYRNVRLGKGPDALGASGEATQKIRLTKTESGWRISDLAGIIPVLSREIAAEKDKTAEEVRKDRRFPF